MQSSDTLMQSPEPQSQRMEWTITTSTESAGVVSGSLKQRSSQHLEFGLANGSGQMNCFLNAALQLIWGLSLNKQKAGFIDFVKMPTDQGPEVLRPLMKAMIDLFKQAGDHLDTVTAPPILVSDGVRSELFKLFYGQQVFDLNLKADAFEAFDFLLTCLHSWIRHHDSAA